jgi:Holliday junction resolvasome RuvABC endonuclease subunit
MPIVAVDPGTVSLGVALWDGETRYSWTIHCRNNHPYQLRLRIIRKELSERFTAFYLMYEGTIAVTLEEGIFFKRPKVCSMLGEVRGIVMAEAWRRGWNVTKIAPVTWKRSLTAEERKMKKDSRYVAYWNKRLHAEAKSPDEVDAVLIARYVTTWDKTIWDK